MFARLHTLHRRSDPLHHSFWNRIHLDPLLLTLLIALISLGLVVLASSDAQDPGLLHRQIIRVGLALFLMVVIAQIPVRYYTLAVPWLYGIGIILLIVVLFIGDISNGAQSWLNLGIVRFQPSEIMKLTLPMLIAYYFSQKQLPCSFKEACVGLVLIAIPCLLIAKQPDLGTTTMIAASGCFVLFLAGLRWRYIIGALICLSAAVPILWNMMHAYQRGRVLAFLNPESDPLGKGYQIIQSKIAIGSGGLFGKGWMNGTQSHLEFLPEAHTDFIFAVLGEEFGLLGALLMLVLYACIVLRGLYISLYAQDTFSRLLAGSLILTFCFYAFINIGMVMGLMPVVGVPLPLISYGGTSVVTLLAGFGILMSIQTHRKLLAD
ncbi:MAG TPA: rod shape-determining protein RodA [Gammaproteobacteria bacterium]|nr:rod shape-determining protein RodA [Gammaproteobacteria bacterium]